MNYLSPEQILFIHARMLAETGGLPGILDLGLLQSAAGRPSAVFGDLELYPDIFSKAAALLESLIRNHPFIDGNKRTAITAAGLFLRQNGYRLISANEELERFTLSAARGEQSLQAIARWLRDNARED